MSTGQSNAPSGMTSENAVPVLLVTATVPPSGPMLCVAVAVSSWMVNGPNNCGPEPSGTGSVVDPAVSDPTDSVAPALASDGTDFTAPEELHPPTSSPKDTTIPATSFAMAPTAVVAVGFGLHASRQSADLTPRSTPSERSRSRSGSCSQLVVDGHLPPQRPHGANCHTRSACKMQQVGMMEASPKRVHSEPERLKGGG